MQGPVVAAALAADDVVVVHVGAAGVAADAGEGDVLLEDGFFGGGGFHFGEFRI